MPETKPLVSIVVPVYNSANFLPDLFTSLRTQTYHNLEIICVNDGSQDHSLDILQKYAAADSRIIVVDKHNTGAAKTRNVGMMVAAGKYLCFVDSDDFIEPDTISTLVQTAETHRADAVVFDIDNYDNQLGTYYPNYALSKKHIPMYRVFTASEIKNFYKYLVGFTVNKIYRREYLQQAQIDFPEVGAHEDMPFTYLALSAAARIYYLPKTFYHYRRFRSGSLSDATEKHYEYMLEALFELKKGLQSLGLWDIHQKNYASYVLHMCTWKNSTLKKFPALEFRYSCLTSWFEKLGVKDLGAEYFYHQDDYRILVNTLNMPRHYQLIARAYRFLFRR